MLQNKGVHTDTEITMNRPNIVIKTKKEKTRILIDVVIPTDRIVMQMELETKLKYKSLFNDTINVEHKMYDYTGDNWSHQNNNKKV